MRDAGRLSACSSVLLLLALPRPAALGAHDASSYGGVFRSRNLGGTWLGPMLACSSMPPLIVAVDPHNPSHLLAGTDLGLIVSHNGGLTWRPEARDLIFGAVFAVIFLDGGERAICAAQSGVFRFEAGPLDSGARAGSRHSGQDACDRRLGRSASICSAEIGCLPAATAARTFSEVRRTSETGEMTGARRHPIRSPRVIMAVVDGQVMASEDGGHQWRPGALGGRDRPADIVAADPHVPQRVWAAGAGRVYFSDDLGRRGAPPGAPCPSRRPRYAALPRMPRRTTLVVSTNRGLYRSEDGGETWVLKEDNLPIHLEAGPLARDPADTNVLYAVYSLMPYSEVWRIAVEAGNLSRPLDPIYHCRGPWVSFCSS